MNHFGDRSNKKLSTCHDDLQKVLILAIGRSDIDFGISEAERTFDRQLQYFEEGKSKLDPRVEKSIKRAMHVTGGKSGRVVSWAVDIYAYHPDYETRKKIAYDIGTLCYIAGVIQSCARELFSMGEITHLIRWGGNWDKDGVILHDQSFDDLPHFEIYIP